MTIINYWKIIGKLSWYNVLAHNVKFLRRIARNQIKIKSSVDKAFWDRTKSFLQFKAASVELKKWKTPVNQFFK